MKREVWVFRPREKTAAADQAVEAVKDVVRSRGWGPPQLMSTSVVKGHVLIKGHDASSLYRRMHRAAVAVVSVQAPDSSGPFVAMWPRSDNMHSSLRDCVSLRQLCRHKAFFHRLRWNRDARSWAGGFERWASEVACAGYPDPRCLPMHVFASAKRWSRALLTSEGRQQFNLNFGHPARTDDRGLRWESFGPFHGGDVLHVAGHELPRGFHWDVQAEESVVMSTPIEEWLVRKYVNVSPDAHVRGQEPKAKCRRRL